jgi:hypothetical protein
MHRGETTSVRPGFGTGGSGGKDAHPNLCGPRGNWPAELPVKADSSPIATFDSSFQLPGSTL